MWCTWSQCSWGGGGDKASAWRKTESEDQSTVHIDKSFAKLHGTVYKGGPLIPRRTWCEVFKGWDALEGKGGGGLKSGCWRLECGNFRRTQTGWRAVAHGWKRWTGLTTTDECCCPNGCGAAAVGPTPLHRALPELLFGWRWPRH